MPLYRVWVLTSLSETGYLIISLESMYFRVRNLNLQRLTYTKEYVKRILNDELVDKKNKQYLLHDDPKPGPSIFSLKAIKSIIPVGPSSLPTINLLNAFHSLLIFIGKPLVCTIPSYVKDTTDFLTNSPPLTFFLIMPCLSRLMSRHCILTSHIMKELMLVVFSFKNALINISLRKPFATSFE